MKLNWLLVFIPVGLALRWYGANPIMVFAASALALVPLAALMGEATDALASFIAEACRFAAPLQPGTGVERR